MSKYELTISPDYVPGWTVVDAVRELFQNALDQQTVNPNNTMFFNYNKETETLSIGNKESVLDASSLLLGASTKRDATNLIGKYGEGYKIASLVLARSGKQVTFYNYGNREVWRSRIKKSRRFNGANILEFDIDRKYFWQQVPDNNLTIEVTGITEDEYTDIVNSNLHCQDDLIVLVETEQGRILLNNKHKGMVFVNGLYVCYYENYQYGYDFKPNYINIDRDRKLVSDFNLQWLASNMWAVATGDNIEEIVLKLIENGAADVAYFKNHYSFNKTKHCAISNKAYVEFKERNGEKAVPVTNQSELEIVKQKYTDAEPIIVNENHKHLVTASPLYNETNLSKTELTVRQQLLDWYESIDKCLLTTEQEKRFEELVNLVKN